MMAGEETPLDINTTGSDIIADASTEISLTWTPSVDLAPETYQLYGEVIWELDSNPENNITQNHAVAINAINDLAIIDISGHDTLLHNSEGIFTIIVHNLGTSIATGYTVNLMRHGDDAPLATNSLCTAIIGGSTENISLFWTPPSSLSPDIYQLYGEVIWSLDSNPDNNRSDNHEVTINAINDLAAISITGPNDLTHNEEATYQITIENLGTVSVNDYTVRLMIVGESTPLVISEEVPSISAGETDTIELIWTPSESLQPDTYLIYGEMFG